MSRKLTVGSLFAGIGGFDLGFQRAGFEIKWQVEIDPFCRAVLARHFPDAERYDDVRGVHASAVCSRGGVRCRPGCLATVDVLCGGFPCQDISVAGAGAGLDGERSGLWREYIRLVRELRPGYVVVENVSALLGRGVGRVLGDLAESGYDAEWDCIPASAVGAPHQRDRIWIVAYPNRQRQLQPERREQDEWRRSSDGGEAVADAEGQGLARWVFRGNLRPEFAGLGEDGRAVGDHWCVEPNVGRVAHGIPARVDRLRGLGNSIVPQIAQFIAERIKAAEGVAA